MDTDAAPAVAPERTGADAASDVLALFAVLWAAVTLFHVWGPSGDAFRLFDHASWLGLLQAAAGAVAIGVILRPRSLPLLAALAALGPMILWYEAPITGSHWVVASFVDVAFLLTIIVTRNAERVASIFIPLARWVLIVFYFFAAFAKYNHAFFTPTVSCGNYYFDELTGSLGISVNSATTSWSHIVPDRRRRDRAVDSVPAPVQAHAVPRRGRRPSVPRDHRIRPDTSVLRLLVGARRTVHVVLARGVRSRRDQPVPTFAASR